MARVGARPAAGEALVAVLIVVILLMAATAVMGASGVTPPSNWRELAAYALALLFGLAVGAAELVARYRDRPIAAICSSPAAIYIAVNGAAALSAFWLIYTRRLTITIGIFAPDHPALNALLVGGFGAMAVFRTALFNVKVGDTTVGVGPAAMLQVILRAADRETDRLRAGPRAARVSEIMRGVVYARARDTLPLHCFALMQNLTLEEQNNLEQSLAVLDKKTSMGDQAKSYSLGLLLMNMVGEDVLERAVTGLGERIKGPIPDVPPVLLRAKNLEVTDLPALLEGCLAFAASGGLPAAKDDADLIKPPAAVKNERDQIVIALIRLRARFGAETVSEAIASLLDGRTRLNIRGSQQPIDVSALQGAATVPGGGGDR